MDLCAWGADLLCRFLFSLIGRLNPGNRMLWWACGPDPLRGSCRLVVQGSFDPREMVGLGANGRMSDRGWMDINTRARDVGRRLVPCSGCEVCPVARG